jgi:hypothetical protein
VDSNINKVNILKGDESKMLENINLKLSQIGLIFANAEITLMEGERIYFSKRDMLYEIYKQLTDEGQNFIKNNYPNTFKIIMRR